MDKDTVACALTGRGLAQRQAELRAGVLSMADAVDRLADGIRWRFPPIPDLITRLGPVIDAERHCCAFLRFVLHADPGLGPVTLDVTGPPGTLDILEPWVGTLNRDSPP